MTNTRKIIDADISSAGDDFHVLWTIKKCIELLNFNDDGLKTIIIEGVEHNLSKKIDSTGEKLLGIDLTEYYGGSEFKTAKSIVISQLKYSTNRINENYTFSKLYEGKRKGYDGSIIHRLASTFKAFIDLFGRDKIIEKVKIKLVSNRNFNSSQLKKIEEIQKYIISKKGPLNFNSVLNKLPKIPKEPFLKIQKASKLNSTDFTDFIRVLDLKDCGTNSRLSLKFELIESISKTSLQSKSQFESLFKMVWDKMMPEERHARTINFLDVVRNFGFHSLENIFPVIQNFEPSNNAIIREQLDEILVTIDNNDSYLPICLHGGAGIGKSTISQQIKKLIPAYSECILFDCYGAGKYQNPEDKRHLHRNGIVQLANELAKKVGTEFLLIKNESEEIYLRELISRIKSAIEILRYRNENAFLLIIIDAADNSITAAEKNGEKSFIEDLINMEIPKGCHFLFTTRTSRKDTLKLPEDYIDILLQPFTLKETTLFTQQNFNNIAEQEIFDFHTYTKGIPRVQFYSLSLKQKGIHEIINYLRPNGKGVEELILDKIKEAIERIGKQHKSVVDYFFKLLISLPRPVPANYISEIMQVRTDFLTDLSSDIWNGLIYEDGLFSFRDEDFENYIKETYRIGEDDLQKITQMFITKSETDEYASINLANLLFQTNRTEQLIDIVLNKKLLTYPKDPIRNKELYMTRAKLALKVSDKISDNLTYFKLLVIAAEELKTDIALNNLLVEYPDLVTRFGDEISLTRLKLKAEEKPWGGSFHLKLAGIHSRRAETKEISLKHLRIADNWLKWRNGKKDLKNYPIYNIDIAYQIESILRIFGVQKAIEVLNQWKPKKHWLFISDHLIENLFVYSSEDKIKEWVKYSRFRLDSKIYLVCKIFKFKYPIHFDLTNISNELMRALSKKKIKFSKEFKLVIIEFCEILSSKKIDPKNIIQILEYIESDSLNNIPYFYNQYSGKSDIVSMQITLKKEILKNSLYKKQIDIQHFYPDRFKNLDEIKDYEKRESLENEKKEFRSFYKYAISIYQLNSDLITKRISMQKCHTEFLKICKEIEGDYNFKYENRTWYNDRLRFLAGKLAKTITLFKDNELLTDTLIKSFDNQIGKLSVRFEVLDKIILEKNLLTIVLKTLDETDQIIKTSNSSSTEATENYIKCLKLSSKIDHAFSKYFFNQAIESLSDIDYEAISKIKCIGSLSKLGITTSNPKLAYEYSRFIEFSDIKLNYYDKDNFPYLEGIIGISNLDIDSVFSIICRWHHRNIINIEDVIIPIINNIIEKNYIDISIASSLLILRGKNYNNRNLEKLYSLLIKRLDKVEKNDIKSEFIRNEFKILRLQKDTFFVKKLYQDIKSGKFLDQSIISELKTYYDFIEELDEKKNIEEKYPSKMSNNKDNINLDEVDYLTTKGLEKAIDNIYRDDEKYSSNTRISNLLLEIKTSCLPTEYISFLDALIEVNENLLSFHLFEQIIKECLNEWDFYPEVKTWKKTRFKYILLIKIQHFYYNNGLSLWAIKEFTNIFSIDETSLSNALIEILPKKIDSLSDESIYSSFELIKNKLTTAENEELISWILNRWNKNIDNEFSDGIWSEELMPKKNNNENIAYLLRFILGHPDKRFRWLAIHSIRNLSKSKNTEILKMLINLQNNKDCFPYQNKKYIFYWISAKLYLWIAIERISLENPSLLFEFKELFYSELINEELPHVLIKYFIQKTCINLYNTNNSIYSDFQITTIQNHLKTSLGYVEEELYSREQRKYANSSEDKWNFNFSSIDTLPYWYNRVGHMFNLSEYDVADIAEKFIIEKWGYSGDVIADDYIRKQLQERDWYLTSNDHGSIPQIEDLSIYFEYHAMYCAAYFLLQNEPLLKSDLNWDQWENWLSAKANAFNDFWLSDLRDSLPLKLEYWQNEIIKFDSEWRDKIDEEYFDEKVGLINNLNDDFLNLDSNIKKKIGLNEETVSIKSCLVSNKGADALLRALQTTNDSYNYSIPFENDENNDDDDDNDKTINQDDFLLQGWLTTIETQTEGLDSDDPFFNEIGKSLIKFGKTVHSDFLVKYDDLYKKAYLDNKLIAKAEIWNEISEIDYHRRKYSRDLETSGSLFMVNKNFVINFLKIKDKCLIIRCIVDRQLEERTYRVRDNKNRVKLYLIKPDGTVKTIRGRNYKIR